MNAKTHSPASAAKAASAAQEFIHCPHWGKGGQYIYDPATGMRTRVAAVVTTAAAPSDADASLAVVTDAAVAQGETFAQAAGQLKKEAKRG